MYLERGRTGPTYLSDSVADVQILSRTYEDLLNLRIDGSSIICLLLRRRNQGFELEDG